MRRFSWRRAVGISSAKARLSRKIGVPLSRSGRHRKFGTVAGILGALFPKRRPPKPAATAAGCGTLGCLLPFLLLLLMCSGLLTSNRNHTPSNLRPIARMPVRPVLPRPTVARESEPIPEPPLPVSHQAAEPQAESVSDADAFVEQPDAVDPLPPTTVVQPEQPRAKFVLHLTNGTTKRVTEYRDDGTSYYIGFEGAGHARYPKSLVKKFEPIPVEEQSPVVQSVGRTPGLFPPPKAKDTARRKRVADSRDGSTNTRTHFQGNGVADRPLTVTVYVTESGDKYHRAGCQYLRRSRIAISLDDAQRSYSPCSRCSPP